MPDETDPEQIRRRIEDARVSLADAVDELAYRTSPKKVSADLKQTLAEKAQTPAGKAVLGGAGLLLFVLVVKRLRK